jgi:tetratricopeptide (TPR) repeat protein
VSPVIAARSEPATVQRNFEYRQDFRIITGRDSADPLHLRGALRSVLRDLTAKGDVVFCWPAGGTVNTDRSPLALANTNYRMVRDLDPHSSEFLSYRKLSAYLLARRYGGAVEAAASLPRSLDDVACAYFLRSSAYYYHAVHSGDLSCLDRAIESVADYEKRSLRVAEAYESFMPILKASALFYKKKYDAARVIFAGILAGGDLSDGAAFNNMGAVSYALGEFQESAEYFRRAIACRGRAKFWSNLAAAYIRLGEPFPVIEAILRASCPPGAFGHAGTFYNLACVYSLTGQHVDAMRQMERSLTLKPSLSFWAEPTSDPDLEGLRAAQPSAFTRLVDASLKRMRDVSMEEGADPVKMAIEKNDFVQGTTVTYVGKIVGLTRENCLVQVLDQGDRGKTLVSVEERNPWLKGDDDEALLDRLVRVSRGLSFQGAEEVRFESTDLDDPTSIASSLRSGVLGGDPREIR